MTNSKGPARHNAKKGGTQSHSHGNGRERAKVAHQTPGRLRLRLERNLSREEEIELVADLKLSPEVKDVKVSGKSVVIIHTDEDQHPWSLIEEKFPLLGRISDGIDAAVAKAAETPEVNKIIPLGFLGFGLYKAIEQGALFAGESSFAIIYIAFDLYWKFQQENVTRKIEQGLSKQQQSQLEQDA